MESWLSYLTTQSLEHLLIIITIVSFLESLALVGLLLPGIVLMTALGTLIGQGKIGFYPSCLAGIIGCLLGDWISYYIGWTFKKWIHNLYLFKKHSVILEKTKQALYNYSSLTILIGRFIGPTRPVIPLLSGMLKLPLKKFIIPNLLGCLLWPPLYFLPGIFTGILINSPEFDKNYNFKWILTIILCLNWFGCWLFWKWKKLKKIRNKKFIFNMSEKTLLIFSILIFSISFLSLIAIQFSPEMYILRHLVWTVLFTL